MLNRTCGNCTQWVRSACYRGALKVPDESSIKKRSTLPQLAVVRNHLATRRPRVKVVKIRKEFSYAVEVVHVRSPMEFRVRVPPSNLIEQRWIRRRLVYPRATAVAETAATRVWPTSP